MTRMPTKRKIFSLNASGLIGSPGSVFSKISITYNPLTPHKRHLWGDSSSGNSSIRFLFFQQKINDRLIKRSRKNMASKFRINKRLNSLWMTQWFRQYFSTVTRCDNATNIVVCETNAFLFRRIFLCCMSREFNISIQRRRVSWTDFHWNKMKSLINAGKLIVRCYRENENEYSSIQWWLVHLAVNTSSTTNIDGQCNDQRIITTTSCVSTKQR